jgi:hypothetical protein
MFWQLMNPWNSFDLFVPDEVRAPQIVGKPRSVGEQVAQRDRPLGCAGHRLIVVPAYQDFHICEFRRPAACWRVELELTLLDQLHGRSPVSALVMDAIQTTVSLVIAAF